MLRLSVSLTALALCLAFAGSASAHGSDGAERADRGERADRADRAEREGRAERDRSRDADKVSRDIERDARKASERAVRDNDAGESGSGSAGRSDNDLRTSDGSTEADPDDASGDDRRDDESGDEQRDERSDSSGSGSGDALEDESDSSDLEDFDEDDNSGDDNSGSDDDADEDRKDEDDDNDDDDKDDDDGGDDGEKSANLISDDSGHVYRDREVLILLPEPDELERLSEAGFTVIEKRQLRRDGAQLIRVGFAADVKAVDAVSQVRELYPSAAIDLSHVYKASAEAAGSAGKPMLPDKLDDRRSDVSIAVIDGFSAGSLPDGVELKSFVKRRSDLPHGAQVMSVLLDDLKQMGEGHPKRLLAADVAEHFKDSGAQASAYNLVDALDWAAAEGADIINISLAGPPNQVLAAVVDGLHDEGILMFAAVGNTGPASRPGYPAAYGSVVGVTAVSSNGAPYMYAARGEEVELSAQGVGIRISPDSDILSGTSFAVPRVVALAAWLMNGTPANNHREGLRTLARDLGAPGRDNVYGYGLVPVPDELKPD
ncbi:S8 family serine peptidase [Hyphomonas sp.]|uniref:S8 family serine peptidase n=1 Tax=Hyphomonas sp. TaxID=87 RepID=UPI0025C22A27|nr:S8 family serine peptidase [Hyphomonas sp.]